MENCMARDRSTSLSSQTCHRRCTSAPHLRDDAPLLPQRVHGLAPALERLREGLEHAVAHGRGAADEHAAGHLVDPVLHRGGLRSHVVLHVLALLPLPRPRECGEEASQRALGPNLHARQSPATCGELHGAAHLLLKEPILISIPAPEEQRRRRRLRPPAELFPEAAEGGDAGSGADHDDRDVLRWKVQRRGPLLGEHHVARLDPAGEPPRARAEEASPASQERRGTRGQASSVDELLTCRLHVGELVARQANAKGDALRRGLGRGSNGEFTRLLPGTIQQKVHGTDLFHSEHRPELVHLAAECRTLEHLHRFGVR
mmetsp:Transcript_16936/g.43177  ORF Transcript_16936/g.43177 Transcript_16936/m.43177 type:complete len:316 (+) Transcript_16936:69-1016(+)